MPGTKSLNLSKDEAGKSLNPIFKKGFEYSDCWVDDARLVVLNAKDAKQRGATIWTRTKFVSAERQEGIWQIGLESQSTPSGANSNNSAASDGGDLKTIKAKGIINAGGPWVEEVLKDRLSESSKASIRLVRGSHIITKKLFDHDRPYMFQQADGRIIFAIPYENDFTLIGTTDADHEEDPAKAACSDSERDYLLAAANGYFTQSITVDDVVWSYAGVRPLYDDGASSATAATRDYVLTLSDEKDLAPLLNIFGGKITTYRKLSEAVLDKISPYFTHMKGDWTAGVSLPGGDFPVDGQQDLIRKLRDKYAFLTDVWAQRLVRAYGTETDSMLQNAKEVTELGQHFGWNLYQREVEWLKTQEWAQTAEDIVWRRSKIGLRLSSDEIEGLEHWLQGN